MQWNKYACELIGTYFFVMAIVLTAGGAVNPLAPLAIGLALMTCIYSVGPVSGGHFNPAVSLGVLLSGRSKISLIDTLIYSGVQIVGGILGALTARLISDLTLALQPGLFANPIQATAAEIIFSAFLVYTVLNVATTNVQQGNSYFGFAIGMSVCVSAFSIGGISGCCLNPAVALGATFVRAVFGVQTEYIYLPLYVLAPLTGGALAAGMFRLVRQDEYAKAKYCEGEPSESDDLISKME
eukprot:GHVR01169887.1.p1 GENE.GHVR01169887.1~~GHVR01169887.1.p1  ORF type:complete len:253 (+),score=43.06 GHVR01169887.1:40-759(+)